MGKLNFDEVIDEVLFEKKKPSFKKKKKPIKEEEVKIDKILEKKDEMEMEEPEDKKDDKVIEIRLNVNDSEAFRQFSGEEYSNIALTDFASIVSVFRDSNSLDVKRFLGQLGMGGNEPAPPVDVTAEETPEQPQEEELNSFSLFTEEFVGDDENTTVSISGSQNVNNMLSFKVTVDGNPSSFNTPESAIAHFNNVFFNNIVKLIDKEMEKRRDE